MDKSFTSRMDWLHTWFGLILGWLAFVLFLTGTISVFWFEISYWAQPELHGRKMLSPQATVQYSVDYFKRVAPHSKRWSVYMPDFERHPLLVLNWLDENDTQHFARLVPDGSGREVTTVTNGGRFFVDFHFAFNRVPDSEGRRFQWTYMLSGLGGLAFLIGTITGVIVHKKIFRNFFTFRRTAKVVQTRWLDAHNVVGVLAWPFHVMIVLSGLMFYSYLYIPTGMRTAARYPAPAPPRAVYTGGAAGFVLWGRFDTSSPGAYQGGLPEPGNPASTVPLTDLFSQAQAQMGKVFTFTVTSPDRDNEIVRFARAHGQAITFTTDTMAFDGVTGRVISPPGNRVNAVQKLTNIFAGIHFAFYGGHTMRLLYFLCGASGTIMVAVGLILFTTKRRAMAHSPAAARFYEIVDRMNVAAIAGSIFACASYFWAIRLLPSSLSDPSGAFPGGVYSTLQIVPLSQATRTDFEMYVFWLAWGVAAVHALARAPRKAWAEQLAATAVLCLGFPAIGYLVPNCDIGSMIAAGDWKMVAVDLGGMSIGFMLLWAAWKASPKHAGVRVRKLAGTSVLSPAD
jgi:uncharacterized iron-regulated membrane protein